MQSHLSENFGEIAWSAELSLTLLSTEKPTINMGCSEMIAKRSFYCVHSTEDEIKMMKDQGSIYRSLPRVKYKPFLGVAPIENILIWNENRSWKRCGSGFYIIHVYKCLWRSSAPNFWRLSDQELKPLNIEEVFYLATRGGGEFLAK